MSNEVGRLHIITGPMFSGKSTELLRRVCIEKELGMTILFINHSSDVRTQYVYSTHNPLYKDKLYDERIEFIKSNNLQNIDVKEYDIIAIDEAQFFTDLKNTVIYWVERLHKHVIVAGLTNDCHRNIFGQVLSLEPFCDDFIKLSSYCKRCSQKKKRVNATFSYRYHNDTMNVEQIGGADMYVSLCRKCYLDKHKI